MAPWSCVLTITPGNGVAHMTESQVLEARQGRRDCFAEGPSDARLIGKHAHAQAFEATSGRQARLWSRN